MGKKKQNRKSEYAVSPTFKQHVQKSYGNVVDMGNAPDALRLSDRISRLIDPYIESMDSVLLVDCAAIAWNECLEEDFGIRAPFSLNNAVMNFARLRDLIDALKDRKRTLFKDNSRHIKEIKVFEKGDSISINVASDLSMGDVAREAFDKVRDMLLAHLDPECDDDAECTSPGAELRRGMKAVVSREIEAGTMPILGETLLRLQTAGVSETRAKEKIAAVLIADMLDRTPRDAPRDGEALAKRLNELT